MRALIFLLALLLPLQLSWAAVAGYCQTEVAPQSNATAHAGHHEHPALQAAQVAQERLAAASDTSGAPASDEGNAGNALCSLCDFAAMKPVQLYRPVVTAPLVIMLPLVYPGLPQPASHIADGPDKPNWSHAA